MSAESSEVADRHVLSRSTAEIALAAATFSFGAVVVHGSLEFGIAWSSSGPSAGSFPGLAGTVICLASLANLVQAVRRREAGQAPLLTRAHMRRILAFVGPMTLFLAAAYFVGLYVASAVYLAGVMIGQGRYKVWQGIVTGLAAALFFYVVLERWFQVPLLKGPLEAALGIH
jgi:hypothetical protein